MSLCQKHEDRFCPVEAHLISQIPKLRVLTPGPVTFSFNLVVQIKVYVQKDFMFSLFDNNMIS